jgi:hypothetical protein
MKYNIIEVSELELEDLIRKNPENIEVGLKYIDHQVRAGRGPLDVLLVDSGKALVIAELKIEQDDSMLQQGLNYYDYIAANIDGVSRAYSKFNIDPFQEPRLLLIAPAFSQILINSCKWLNMPISLFEFQCIELEDRKGEVIPIFKEIIIPSRPEIISIPTIEEHMDYITDPEVRKRAEAFLEEIKQCDINKITAEAVKYDISLKISGRLFGYLGGRRKFFVVSTWDEEDKWVTYQIKDEEDLEQVRKRLKQNLEAVKADYNIV